MILAWTQAARSRHVAGVSFMVSQQVPVVQTRGDVDRPVASTSQVRGVTLVYSAHITEPAMDAVLQARSISS